MLVGGEAVGFLFVVVVVVVVAVVVVVFVVVLFLFVLCCFIFGLVAFVLFYFISYMIKNLNPPRPLASRRLEEALCILSYQHMK